MEEVAANTNEANLPSAVVVSELNDNLQFDIYVGDDGKLHKIKGGADTALNFSRSADFKSVYYQQCNGNSDSFSYTVPDQVSNIVAIAMETGSVSVPSGYYLKANVCPGYRIYAYFYKVKKGETYRFSLSSPLNLSTYLQVCAG